VSESEGGISQTRTPEAGQSFRIRLPWFSCPRSCPRPCPRDASPLQFALFAFVVLCTTPSLGPGPPGCAPLKRSQTVQGRCLQHGHGPGWFCCRVFLLVSGQDVKRLGGAPATPCREPFYFAVLCACIAVDICTGSGMWKMSLQLLYGVQVEHVGC
jgi:hypothetical protein